MSDKKEKKEEAPAVKMIKIKPGDGFKVKKPDGDFLKKEGESVPASVYWSRRIRFGEVVLVEAENGGAKQKEAKQKKEDKPAAKPEAKKEDSKAGKTDKK